MSNLIVLTNVSEVDTDLIDDISFMYDQGLITIIREGTFNDKRDVYDFAIDVDGLSTEEALSMRRDIRNRFLDKMSERYGNSPDSIYSPSGRVQDFLDKVTNDVLENICDTYQDVKTIVREANGNLRVLWRTNRRLVVIASVLEGTSWLAVYALIDWLLL